MLSGAKAVVACAFCNRGCEARRNLLRVGDFGLGLAVS